MAMVLGTPDRVASYADAVGLGLVDAMNADPLLTLYLAPESAGAAGQVPDLVREHFGESRTVKLDVDQLMRRALTDAREGGWPVVQIGTADLLCYGLNDLAHYALEYANATNEKPRRPLTVRSWFDGDEARLLEGWLMQVPGLRTTLPAIASDAYRLLRSAIRHTYPTVVIEHPGLVQLTGEMRPDGFAAAGKGKVMREGGDVTVIAFSRLVHEAMQAADILAQRGVELEVIDPRWLMPLDLDNFVASVRKTGHCVVAHEGWQAAGAGATIAAQLHRLAFDALKTPIGIVGATPGRVPTSDDIVAAVLATRGEAS